MKNNQSLSNRLLITVVLFSLLYLLIAASFLSVFYLEQATESVQETERKLVLTVSNSAAIALYVDNPVIATEVMQALLLHDEVLGVKLVGHDGVEFSASKLASDQGQWQNIESFPLYSPVANEVIGRIQLDVNQGYIDQLTRDQVKVQLSMLLVELVILLVAMLIAVRHIIGIPLTELAKGLAKVKPGYAEKLPVHEANRENELGLVTQSINNFVESSAKALEVERELRATIERMEQHYRHIFDTTQVGILVLDENGRLIHSNPTLFGRLLKENYELLALLESQPFFKHVFEAPDEAWKLSEQAMSSGDVASGDLRINARYSPDQWVHLLLSAYQDGMSGEWFIEGIMYDVTARVQREYDILLLALEDKLTGLKNRLGCERFIQHRQALHAEEYVAVMLLDLDGFKPINDQHGHAAGDEVLRVIARRLQHLVREEQDEVARMGGDELLVVLFLTEISSAWVQAFAERVLAACSKPIELADNGQVMVTCSVGVAYAPTQDMDFDRLVEQADEAMYHVKNHGRNGVHYYQSPSS